MKMILRTLRLDVKIYLIVTDKNEESGILPMSLFYLLHDQKRYG